MLLFKSFRLTIIQVMLSHPKPVEVSGATRKSSSYSAVFPISYLLILVLTNLMICWLVLVSQIPSHPRIMNSSLLVSFLLWKSGTAIIFYSSWESLGSFLYSKSPIHLERFRFPSILPSVTKPKRIKPK